MLLLNNGSFMCGIDIIKWLDKFFIAIVKLNIKTTKKKQN